MDASCFRSNRHRSKRKRVQVSGSGPSGSDLLAVSQTATLGGTLEIIPVDGYTPMIGDSIQVVSCATRTGTFDTVTGLDLGGTNTMAVDYAAGAVTLTVAMTTGLTVAPSAAGVGVGQTIELTALAQLAAGGPTDVSADAGWSTDDPAIAAVDPAGNVLGIGIGTTTIRATFQGFNAAANVTVSAAPVPAVSPQALAAMAFLLLVAGGLAQARRRKSSA